MRIIIIIKKGASTLSKCATKNSGNLLQSNLESVRVSSVVILTFGFLHSLHSVMDKAELREKRADLRAKTRTHTSEHRNRQ